MVYHPSLQSLWQAHLEEVMIPIKEWTEVEIELTAFSPASKKLFWICGQQLAVVWFFFFPSQRKATVCIVQLVSGSELFLLGGFPVASIHTGNRTMLRL